MTLRQKITLQVGAMLVGLLLVSAAAFWGIRAVHQDYGVALDGYQRLRQVYVAGTHLATAQKLLQWSHPQAVSAARAEVRAAITNLEPMTDSSASALTGNASGTHRPSVEDKQMASEGTGPTDADVIARLRLDLRRIATNLELIEASPAAGGLPPPDAVQTQRDAVIEQLGRIAALSSGIRRETEAAQHAGDARRQATVALLAALCGAVVLVAVVVGALHYRGVMRPIRRLSEGVHRLTAGQFKGRVDVLGKDELASLAADFNRMAGELDGFYRELEQKVAAKSRELVRSERLASVGYLAAGVAHEINNPLGIISGYAEYAMSELKRAGHADDAEEPARSLKVIFDEAFRCKAITQKLLSLARGGDDEARSPVSLLKVANEVASVIGALREHRGKTLVVRAAWEAGSADEPLVQAVEAEMKQVLLNLTVNALEAVPDVSGQVKVELRRAGGEVELTVSDNGRGMSTATLERVFEPFFTAKRGAGTDGRLGTGLGLSITHAIVQAHGGTLSAESDGEGSGSRFVIRLPVAE